MSPQITLSVFWLCNTLRMDFTLFKNSKKFPDGAVCKARLQIFENVDINFRAQASISLPMQYSSILISVNFRFLL
jgi:hypothetical protein